MRDDIRDQTLHVLKEEGTAVLLVTHDPEEAMRMADEIALMREHRVEALVSKNSGGEATRAKIAAARELGLPVVMVRRPAPPPGDRVETVEAALDWLRGRAG